MSEAIDISTPQRKILLALLRRFIPGVEVWAYGSRAKWTARLNSDLDLVAFTSPEQNEKISALKEALAESDLPFLVDLHVWSEVPERFHEIIRKEYVVIQEESRNPLPDGWRTLPLEECMAAIIDYRGKTPTKTTFGVPLVTAKIVKGGRIESPEEFIAESDYEPWMRRGMPEKGDVVMTTEAPLGEVAQLDGRKVALAQRVITLRGKPDLLDNGYLRYLLQSTSVQDEFKARATGTTVLGIKQSELRKVRLTLPPLPFQKSIAHILGTLDDKIDLNRRTNDTLEAMARALFQSWFMDFDPVRRNAEGGNTWPEDSLFPDSFENSEMGEVPNGWKVLSLDKIATYLNGLALQKFPPSDGETLPVIKIAQLRKGDSSGADRCNTDVPNDYVVQDGDVLFSWSGSLEVELWCGGPGALNQHLFKVTSAEFQKWFYYLWTLYHLDEFRLIAASKATTMGHIQRKHLTDAKVLVPPRPLLGHMTEVMSPIVDRIIANRIESRTLATLRDALLPKLLSGGLALDKKFQSKGGIALCP